MVIEISTKTVSLNLVYQNFKFYEVDTETSLHFLNDEIEFQSWFYDNLSLDLEIEQHFEYDPGDYQTPPTTYDERRIINVWIASIDKKIKLSDVMVTQLNEMYYSWIYDQDE